MSKYKELYLKSQLELNGLIDKINYNYFNPQKRESERVKMYKTQLLARDSIICANRYKWTLPINLTSLQLELMFYNFGSLCFFVDKGTLKISRFAKVGALNSYGIMDKVQPIDLAGKAYGVEKTVIREDGKNALLNDNICVIISDYSGDFTENGVIPRKSINYETTIKDEANAYEFMYNDLRMSIKKLVGFCDNENQSEAIRYQLNELLNPTSPVSVASVDKNSYNNSLQLQSMANNYNAQNYTQIISFYDKTRLNFDGIETGDLSEKKERKITGEVESANEHTSYVYNDGLFNRINGVNLIKKYLKFDGVETLSVEKSDIEINKEMEKTENAEPQL